jgi:predicted regulator of Ras-like GTPase activity (Roadblock/LC7/MglB family)
LCTSWRRFIVTPESSLIASTTMDAGRALADLVEISPQIEAAAIVSGEGEPVGSFGVPEARAGLLARAVLELLDAAAAFRTEGRVTQLHAALDEGDVFAVTGWDEQTIVAVAGEQATPGLVFYDLKQCLRRLADEA